MRSLQLIVLFSAASSSALSVTEAGMTFTTSMRNDRLYGGGEVWVVCSPCSEPLNTLKGGFRGVEFMYQNAPGVRGHRSGGLFIDRVPRFSFETSSPFPYGARLYPVINEAFCQCGNVAEVSQLVDFPRPDLAFTTDPSMAYLGVLVSSPDRQKATVGKTDRVIASCYANPQPGEQAIIEVHGPGIDLRHEFTSGDSGKLDAQITPTAPGTIEAWCTFMPYGNKSKVLTAEVVAPKIRPAPDSPDEDGMKEAAPETGCSTTGAPSVALLAALLMITRSTRSARRRAP